MMNRQSHIVNVQVLLKPRTPRLKERVLVIDTNLTLPQARYDAADPRIEELLLEVHELKTRNPALFDSVDTVEIRGADHHVAATEDVSFPFVSGERVPSSACAVNMSAA